MIGSPQVPKSVAVLDRDPAAPVLESRTTGARMVVLTPTLYHRLPEMEDSLRLAQERYEDRHGHGHIRHLPSILRTLIDRSRNMMVDAYLKKYPDVPFCQFVDHDMFYPTGDVDYWRSITKSTLPERFGRVNFFERMLSHGPEHQIIGALYIDRKNGVEYQCDSGHNEPRFNERVNKGELRGVLRQKWVATGGMRIAREALLKMIAAAPQKFPDTIPVKHGREWGLFSRGLHAVGEDVAFCLRAGELGIASFVDLDCRCWHQMQTWV